MSFNKKPKTINPAEVDPSVYYYDEVYEEMKYEEDTKSTSHSDREKEKSSKYMQGLLETAELRKTEKELRKFKRNIKDREEAERSGDLREEDVFVTSTYKKKLGEYREMEKEKMKRLEQEKDNSMNFIKKQATNKSENFRSNTKTEEFSTASLDNQKGLSCDKITSTTSFKGNETNDTRENQHSTNPQKIVKRSLRSIEDRRQYLQEVLAKKTIGKAYDDAVQRYMERKSRKCNQTHNLQE